MEAEEAERDTKCRKAFSITDAAGINMRLKYKFNVLVRSFTGNNFNKVYLADSNKRAHILRTRISKESNIVFVSEIKRIDKMHLPAIIETTDLLHVYKKKEVHK